MGYSLEKRIGKFLLTKVIREDQAFFQKCITEIKEKNSQCTYIFSRRKFGKKANLEWLFKIIFYKNEEKLFLHFDIKERYGDWISVSIFSLLISTIIWLCNLEVPLSGKLKEVK